MRKLVRKSKVVSFLDLILDSKVLAREICPDKLLNFGYFSTYREP